MILSWGNPPFQEDKAALQLQIYLVDLATSKICKSFQCYGENFGGAMYCVPLGGRNHVFAP